MKPNAFTHSVKNSEALAWAVGAVVSFHLAYAVSALSFLVLGFLFCLFQLRNIGSGRKAFYFGLVIGFAVYAPQLKFFWTLFGPGAISLWLVLSLWLALFLLLAQMAVARLGEIKAALLIPFLWTGLEYFRSELYYLKFSWMNAGYALANHPRFVAALHGVYGVSFWAIVVFSVFFVLSRMKRLMLAFCLPAVFICAQMFFSSGLAEGGPVHSVKVAGVQLEFPHPDDVLKKLEQLHQAVPQAELLVLSECTFDGEVPQAVRDWCREKQVWLVAGGKEDLGRTNFYNTAFVVGTNGNMVFRQHKSVPVQFMKDGLPAEEQGVWESPWGKIGVAICYDLSYSRVIDRLVEKGAQALVIPTMDVEGWGAYQHGLHARVAPVRAAEYGIPIFKVCSSGLSQIVDRFGNVGATGSFPGYGDVIEGTLTLRSQAGAPRVPFDRGLALLSVVVTGVFILGLGYFTLMRKLNVKP